MLLQKLRGQEYDLRMLSLSVDLTRDKYCCKRNMDRFHHTDSDYEIYIDEIMSQFNAPFVLASLPRRQFLSDAC
jgi:hypothetical protein